MTLASDIDGERRVSCRDQPASYPASDEGNPVQLSIEPPVSHYATPESSGFPACLATSTKKRNEGDPKIHSFFKNEMTVL